MILLYFLERETRLELATPILAKVRHGEHYRTAGYYLRVYRQRADLTQMELAKQTGIHQHHLSDVRRQLG